MTSAQSPYGYSTMSPAQMSGNNASTQGSSEHNALIKLSPSLQNLQSALEDVRLPDSDKHIPELDDELSAQLQHLGLQISHFQEHLAHVIGPRPLAVRRPSGSPLESCSSQDLGHMLSSDLSTSLYPASSSGSRIASPRMWDHLAASSTANIPHLCEMLMDSSTAVQAAAVGSLRSLTGNAFYCSTVVEAGAVPCLVKMMAGSSSPDVQEAASGVLWNMAACRTPDINAALLEANAVKAAVPLLASSNADLQSTAAALLAELTVDSSSSSSSSSIGDHVSDQMVQSVVQQMAAAGAIPLLLALTAPPQQQQEASPLATQTAAVQCLKALVQVPSNRLVLAAAGAAAVLVPLLAESCSSSMEQLLEPALAVVQQLCKEPLSHGDVLAANGVEVLVRLLDSQEADVQIAAAGALGSIAASTDEIVAAAAAAAIPALLDLLSSPAAAVQAAAAAALKQLACNDASRKQIAAADGVLKLSNMIASSTSSSKHVTVLKDSNANIDGAAQEEVQVLESAALALQNLAVEPDNCAAAIASAKLVPALASLLSCSSSKVAAAAAGCLANLAWDSEGCAAVVGCEGVLQQLVLLLKSGEQQVVLNAANVVAKLAWEPALCEELASAGALLPLIELLSRERHSSTDAIIRETAAAALQNLTYEDSSIRRSCIAAGVLPTLSKLLHKGTNQVAFDQVKTPANSVAGSVAGSDDGKCVQGCADCVSHKLLLYVLGVLYNLSLETGNASAVAEAGAVEPLVALLECDVEELVTAAGRCVGKLAVTPAVRQAIAKAY